MRYFFVITILFAIACKDKNKLEEKEQTLDLSYIAWACNCANWATQVDREKYADNADSLAAHCIFLEPADSTAQLPQDSLYSGSDVIRFTGGFYVQKGVPADRQDEQRPDKARIFRYTKYEVIERDYSRFWAEPDTFVIDKKAAVFYKPDSATISARMEDENFRIGMGDYAGGAHEADTYLESMTLPVLVSEGKNYLKFVHDNGKFTIIKTDSLRDIFGLYFFDPAKQPKPADVFNIEKEFADYFK